MCRVIGWDKKCELLWSCFWLLYLSLKRFLSLFLGFFGCCCCWKKGWGQPLYGQKKSLFFSYLETYQLLINLGSLLKKQQTACKYMVSHLFAFKSIEPIKYLYYVQVINNLWLFIQPLNKHLSSATAHILVHYLTVLEWFTQCLLAFFQMHCR